MRFLSCTFFDVLRLSVNSEFEDLNFGKDCRQIFLGGEKNISYTVELLGNGA